MTQKQREALFDLITLAPYSDSHLSITEENLAESAFIAEGWESEHPKSLFLEQSLARARAAADADETMAEYLAKCAANFTDAGSQTEAYGVVSNVVGRDGLNASESAFLGKLKAAFPKLD